MGGPRAIEALSNLPPRGRLGTYTLHMEPTYVNEKPKLWLRLEGLVLLIATVVLFAGQDIDFVRKVRDEIKGRVESLLAELLV